MIAHRLERAMRQSVVCAENKRHFWRESMHHRKLLSDLVRAFGVCMLWAVAALITTMPALFAADWKPANQVELVVPNSPGGNNDAVARVMQKLLQDRQLITTAAVVSNKPAGGGSATLS